RMADEAAAAGVVEVDELLVVGPEALDGAGGQVADRVAPARVDGVHRRRVDDHVAVAADALVDVEVDVVDLRRDARTTAEGLHADVDIDAAGRVVLPRARLELVLPARTHRGRPAGTRRGVAG